MSDYTCAECGYQWPNITSADECAVIDAAEARLTRNAGKRRVTRDVVKSDDHLSESTP